MKKRIPVGREESFADFISHQKRGESARASPTAHHTFQEERTARFTAQPSPPWCGYNQEAPLSEHCLTPPFPEGKLIIHDVPLHDHIIP